MKKIRLRAFLFALLFTVSSAVCPASSFAADNEPLVISGKNGWLFYAGDSSIEDYQGTNLYTFVELELIRQQFVHMRDVLAEEGIEFVVLLAPNKERIYPEYMPDSFGPIAPFSRIEQVYQYLKDDVRVVYPYDALMKAKTAYPQYDLYYHTDTHWNYFGAYVAAKELLEELGKTLPDIEDISVEEVTGSQMELARLSGDPDLLDTGYIPMGYTSLTVNSITDDSTFTRYFTEGAEDKKVLLIGDSFGVTLSRYLAPFYREVYALYRGMTDESDLLETEKPDIVIYEVLERFTDIMKAYSIVDW